LRAASASAHIVRFVEKLSFSSAGRRASTTSGSPSLADLHGKPAAGADARPHRSAAAGLRLNCQQYWRR
jgi:hypothetical protein